MSLNAWTKRLAPLLMIGATLTVGMAMIAVGQTQTPDDQPGARPKASGATRPAPASQPSLSVRPLMLKGHDGGVLAVTFSGDGRLIATGSMDQTVKLWNAQTGKLIRTLASHTASVTHVAFSGDGKRLASAGVDGVARVWECSTGKLLAMLKGHENHIHSLAISQHGDRVVTGSCDNTARLWNVAQEKAVGIITLDGIVSALDLSPDGQTILVGTTSRGPGDPPVGDLGPAPGPGAGPPAANTVKAFSTKDGKQAWTLQTPGAVRFLRYAADGARVAVVWEMGSRDDLYTFDAATRKLGAGISFDVNGLQNNQEPSMSKDLSTCLLGWGVEAVVADVADAKTLARFVGGFPTCNAVALSPDGRYAACAGGGEGDPYGNTDWQGSGQNIVRVIDLAALKAFAAARGAKLPTMDLRPVDQPPSPKPSPAFLTTADGRTVVTTRFVPAQKQSVVEIIDARRNAEIAKIPIAGPGGPLYTALSADGRLTAIIQDKGARILSALDGKVLRELSPAGDDFFRDGLFAPDGSTFYAIALTGRELPAKARVQAYDTTTWKVTHEWVIAQSAMKWSISPDGKWLAARDGPWANDLSRVSLVVRDAASGTEVRRIALDSFKGQLDNLLRFEPHGVLSALIGDTAYRWDVASGRQLWSIDRHSYGPSSVQYASDGNRLLSADASGQVILWDTASGKILHTYHFPGIRYDLQIFGAGAIFSPTGEPQMLLLRFDGPQLWPLED